MEKEELKDGEKSRGNDTGAGPNPGAGTEQGDGDTSKVGGGGEQGGGQASGESGGASEPSQSGGGGGKDGERESAKIDLLQRIRAKRSNGLGDSSSNADGASHGDSKGNGGGLPGSKRGATNDDSSTTRPNSDGRRGESKSSNSDGGSSPLTSGNDSSNRVKDKAQGVKIKGADKIKELAQKATELPPPPKLKFSWDKDPLTKKEGDELLPKIKGLLEFIFRHADKLITMSNKEKAEAHIWSSIDQEDIDIIAEHLVEMGKGSKVVATAVRRMTNSYRLLQIGLITLPKFIQTYQFYAAHGGLALGGVK